MRWGFFLGCKSAFICGCSQVPHGAAGLAHEHVGGHPDEQTVVEHAGDGEHRPVERRRVGRVILQFIVDENGNVTEPAVVRGIGAGCDEEALRVVREAKFKPGKQRGKAVKVKMSLPITFKLK